MYISNELKNEYDQYVKDRLKLLRSKRDEFLSIHSDIKELKDDIDHTWIKVLREGISQADALKKENELIKKIDKKLKEYNLDSNFLLKDCICEKCEDTGFVNGKMCDCLRSFIEKNMDSNELEHLTLENFDNFNYSYYLGDDLDKVKKNVHKMKEFTMDVINLKQTNLVIYGDPGTGKTFLLNSVINVLIDYNIDVIKKNAFDLIEGLRQITFDRLSVSEFGDCYNCDLLIIDDLGKEQISAYSENILYNLIDRRLKEGRSTLIAVSIPIESISQFYSQSTTSRLFGSYEWIQTVGKDIRLVRKNKNGN